MTREEAIKEALDYGTSKGYGDLSGVIPSVINKIYNDLEEYLDKAMHEAKTWDANVALNEVKKYLEGKDD
jgi:hypothetical protein